MALFLLQASCQIYDNSISALGGAFSHPLPRGGPSQVPPAFERRYRVRWLRGREFPLEGRGAVDGRARISAVLESNRWVGQSAD